jgi:hypothetical protein
VVDEEKMNNNADKLRSYTQPPTASADQTVEEEQKHSKARAKQSAEGAEEEGGELRGRYEAVSWGRRVSSP